MGKTPGHRRQILLSAAPDVDIIGFLEFENDRLPAYPNKLDIVHLAMAGTSEY
jgi:hypothetical protein